MPEFLKAKRPVSILEAFTGRLIVMCSVFNGLGDLHEFGLLE